MIHLPIAAHPIIRLLQFQKNHVITMDFDRKVVITPSRFIYTSMQSALRLTMVRFICTPKIIWGTQAVDKGNDYGGMMAMHDVIAVYCYTGLNM